MFKQLTNVRPEGNTKPELLTTPTSGNIKINSAGASHCKVNVGDYVSILFEDDKDSEWYGLYFVKGNTGDEKNAPFGAKLSSAGKKNAGSMGFSSENAYQSLEGNTKERIVYSIGEGKSHPDFATPLFPLTKVRTEPKTVREKKDKSEAAQ